MNLLALDIGGTAVKYGFNNPIGDMTGDEYIFSTESDKWFEY